MALFHLISCLATILLFDKRVASASIFVLAISDPLSAIVGSKWGRRSLYGKSAEGTGAFFFSALVVLACFSFKWPGLILVAGAASAAELFSSKFVDDNLTIPTVTALALTACTPPRFCTVPATKFAAKSACHTHHARVICPPFIE